MTSIHFTLGPKQRPKLAEEIATALHTIPRYQGVPSLAYQIGDCTLEKDGTLRIPDSVDAETVAAMQAYLEERGFTGEREQTEDRMTVSVPRDTLPDAALANLLKIVENKGALLARAFQRESVRLEVTEDTVSFPWFSLTADPDESAAYTEFVSRLCGMARKSKRVSDKATETDNDKYSFRCFLLRLGFIGNEYKVTRKVLMRNLTGNTAFRHGK